MNAIIAFLFFISVILLVVSLIKPGIFSGIFGEKATRKNLSLIFGGLSILFFIIFPNSDESKQVPNLGQVTSTRQAVPQPIKIDTFSLPAMVGKNWNDLKEPLKKFCGNEAVAKAESSPINTFTCTLENKYNFVFEFDEQGNVTDGGEMIFIGHEQYGETEASVLKAADISLTSDDYKATVKKDSVGQITVTVKKK